MATRLPSHAIPNPWNGRVGHRWRRSEGKAESISRGESSPLADQLPAGKSCPEKHPPEPSSRGESGPRTNHFPAGKMNLHPAGKAVRKSTPGERLSRPAPRGEPFARINFPRGERSANESLSREESSPRTIFPRGNNRGAAVWETQKRGTRPRWQGAPHVPFTGTDSHPRRLCI